MMRIVFEEGADVNFRDGDSRTPLWWAEGRESLLQARLVLLSLLRYMACQ